MAQEKAYRAGVLTVSDKGSRGEREDQSGPAIKELLAGAGVEVALTTIVPDEVDEVKAKLIDWADREKLDLILTTGGTGFSPRDFTPEATRAVIEREAPGLAEVMRAEGLKKTNRAMLSRAVAGIRGRTLIVNLPGSKKGAIESIEAILPALPHGLEILTGRGGECGKSH